MNAFVLTFLVLTIWWVAFSLLVARDKVRLAKERSRTSQPQPGVPPNIVPHHQPLWPSWRELRRRPALFLIAPWCALLYAAIFVLIWPALPVLKISELILRKKELVSEYWPGLLKDNQKVHFLKTDFDKVSPFDYDSTPHILDRLLMLFAALGLFLAAFGIYGVTARLVTMRTAEIGIRIALGAQPRDVLRMVIRHGLRLTVAGAAIGLVLAAAAGQLIVSLLMGVAPVDVVTFGSAAVLFSAIGVAACVVPARRALRINAIEALRYE